MPRIALIYSSIDGQTKKICSRLETVLQSWQLQPEVFSIAEFDKSVSEFDTIILGGSVRYGKHHKLVQEFVEKNRKELEQVYTVFFSVNLVARNEDKNTPETNPYLQKFLKETDWKPDFSGVFAGQLDYSKYGFWDKLMIKLIMKLTHGPTKTETAIEYTQWERVQEFGQEIARSIHGMP
ncbi:oxygen-independent protoporphyrinogen oxidase HemG [Salinimicrobium marinum]|uniref:Protoporphyrinogen IX dehydrogenase [quinone] n=1 Tax=Salinimicrobium marinum TaxID=680283 RepID=A0A918SJ09_9FLAO|nr:menaquinone-dependent protoporphyrinogen IX dehydrogenase [Salinimicrobium marinum]GHA43347.1 oxygen-independent protoporphyrinogen oxidase HemG [Salinimicrobium marinum]